MKNKEENNPKAFVGWVMSLTERITALEVKVENNSKEIVEVKSEISGLSEKVSKLEKAISQLQWIAPLATAAIVSLIQFCIQYLMQKLMGG